MKGSKSYRINLHEQIKAFYSIVYNGEFDLKPTHISLYMFLLNQNNRSMWIEWFKCPFDLAMQGAAISSRTTYYKCLDDLTSFKLIEYEKGLNNFKAPKIKIIPLTVPKNGLVTVPLPDTLLGTLPVHIIRLITNNITLITIHFAEIAKFIETLKKKDKPQKNRWGFIDQIVDCFVEEHGSYEIMSRGKERKMASILLHKFKEKRPEATSEDALCWLRAYFKKCLVIEDNWLRNNMSLSIMANKFNEINAVLKNGKSKNNKGATPYQIADAVAKNFATDYAMHNEEHAENNESVPHPITRILRHTL